MGPPDTFLQRRAAAAIVGLLLLLAGIAAPAQPAQEAMPYDPDTAALALARKYLEGGDGARDALVEALGRMGWSVRDRNGVIVKAAPSGADTGLAMRDYELDELLWNPSEQPTIRLISLAQAMAVPFQGGSDPEELAQDIVETIRKSAASSQPQQRFWARFIVALGRASAANYDLLSSAPPSVILPGKSQVKALQTLSLQDPMALMQAMQPTPVWPDDDPVLAPSPRLERPEGDERPDRSQRDQDRMNELQEEMGKLSGEFGSGDPARLKAAQERLGALNKEMAAISQRMQAASMQQMSSALKQIQKAQRGEETETDESDAGPRFLAEWRDQPLSLLQIGLIARVISADLRLAAFKAAGIPGYAAAAPGSPDEPDDSSPETCSTSFQSGPPTSFGDQFAGAIGDIWATGWGAYTGAVLEHHLPDNKFSKGVSIANTIIAWFKTIMTVTRQKIDVQVESAPLVRTKTRSPGERRTARCRVEIDFPKSDVLKAIRAAGNLTTVDLQLPDGGPVSGAKVVWRLPEGSYNTKYQTAKGGWEYRPDLAVVQFAEAGGNAAYISYTNDSGEATITIEGVPQRKQLSKNVRPYPRRAVIAVEVTIKVGNLTQDLNDAINTAMGGPVSGSLSFIADMILRTSFFFQKGRVFEVTDWKEPAWEGEFEIEVKASGSKHEKGEKGGPDQDFSWSMNRHMEGRLHTPDWAEEDEQRKEYAGDGRHSLEVDGDSRYFRLSDRSRSRSSKSDNRYEAEGPLQIQPPGRNQLALYSRAEPSGSATLLFTGGKMQLDLQPFFGAECLVARSEQGGGRSSTERSGPQYLSLLDGVYPDTFAIIESADESQEAIEGSKTFEARGNLPYVPSFDATVTVRYRLWKNGPPPKNRQ